MTRLFAFVRRLFVACALGWLASALLPANALAASCGPATTQGTAPTDFRTYCWLDMSGYVDATARGTGGQDFTFNLPDGTSVSFNLKSDGALNSVAVPSWSGSAFGNSAFGGIPGKPILYQTTNGSTVNVTISNITVTPPSGGSSTYSMIVGDGESTNSGESLTFTTNGNAWTRVAKIQNGSSTLYPAVSGEGTATVSETGVAGTVGAYVWRSDGNPSQITSKLVGSGLQGIIIGLRYASVAAVSQITNSRYNAADQFTYTIQTSTGLVLASGSTSGTSLSGFAVASVPTVAASYPFTVVETMAAGSVGTLQNYLTTLTCTNSNGSSTTKLPSNEPVSTYNFPALQYGDAVLCTFSNTSLSQRVSGTVYNDANHNGSQDATEAGTGQTLYVKLQPNCSGNATYSAAVDPVTGIYTIANPASGNYCVILDTNNTLSDTTPSLPAGWVGLENASGNVSFKVPTKGTPTQSVNFGLFNGSQLAGTVFADTGNPSGTANDGIRQAGETGLGNVIVTASTGGSAVATATTAGDGSFTLWVPATAGAVTVTPAAPGGYLPTGGSVGSTGGTYTRPTLTYTPASAASYTGVSFGLVPSSTFAPDGAQTAQPGTVVFYPHTFQAGSGGQVSFSVAAVANPAGTGWTTVLYRDAACSGTLGSSDAVVSGAITVTAGQQVCLILKQFVPAGIAYGAQDTVTVTASFAYTGASPALASTLTVQDVTTGGEPTALVLKKLVSNVTRGGSNGLSVAASPGETLQYTLTAQNNGASPLTTLVINDATPAFTTYVGTTCVTPYPAGISGCSVTTQPAAGNAGNLQWTFAGSLAAGAQISVTYQVKLTQ